MEHYQIFISYRRDGGEHLAGRIADKLKEKGYTVFFDVESMRSGTFNTQIFKAIGGCKDFLLILPPKALDRCTDPEDWVRREIAYALEKGKNIIPVMMRDFAFPAVLPPEIDKVRFYEGVAASSDYFDACLEKIIRLLKTPKPRQATSARWMTPARWKAAGMLCGLALLVALLIFGVSRCVQPGSQPGDTTPSDTQSAVDPGLDAQYRMAADYARAGNYGAAAIAYAGCGDYLDAKAQCDLCWEKLTPYNHKTVEAFDTIFLCIQPDGTIPRQFCYYPEMEGWSDLVSLSLFTALRADGTVLAPAELNFDVHDWTDMVAISSGVDFVVGLRKDGTVALAGDRSNGRNAVETWTDIVSVKAYLDAGAVVGLKSDGTAVMAGCAPEYPYDVSHWENIQRLCTLEGFAVDRDGRAFCIYSDAVMDNMLGEDAGLLKTILAINDIEDITVQWCLLRNGKLVTWETGDVTTHLVESWNDIVAAANYWGGIVGLRADGALMICDLLHSVDFSGVTRALVPKGDTHMADWNLVEGKFDNYTLLLKLKENGNYEVRGYTGASVVDLPEKYQFRTIDSIGNAAFYGTDITEFRAHGFVASLGSYAFAKAVHLQTADFQQSLCRDLPEGLFYQCEALETVRCVGGTETVGDYAFYGCIALKELPELSPRVIGSWAFGMCEEMTELSLPQGLTVIPEGCCSGMRQLQVLMIPDTVEQIESDAFKDCGDLREIHYGGTMAQWRALGLQPEDFGIYESDLLKIYCQDGTI